MSLEDSLLSLLLSLTPSSSPSALSSFFSSHPSVFLNLKTPDGSSLLHVASRHCSQPIIELLLARGAYPNKRDAQGLAPLHVAVISGNVSGVRALAFWEKVDVNLQGPKGRSAIWEAANRGNIRAIQWMIASGVQLNLGLRGLDDVTGRDMTAVHVAKERGYERIVALLERHQSNASESREEMRFQLGLMGIIAPRLFALVVFLCDGLLVVKQHRGGGKHQRIDEKTERAEKAGRFFKISSRLPLELQMMLCYRVYGSDQTNVAATVAEDAFRELANVFK